MIGDGEVTIEDIYEFYRGQSRGMLLWSAISLAKRLEVVRNVVRERGDCDIGDFEDVILVVEENLNDLGPWMERRSGGEE